jgi:hypothetical protein
MTYVLKEKDIPKTTGTKIGNNMPAQRGREIRH